MPIRCLLKYFIHSFSCLYELGAMSSSNNNVGLNNGDFCYIHRVCRCGKKASIRIVDSNKSSKGKLYFMCNDCDFWAWCLPEVGQWKALMNTMREWEQNEEIWKGPKFYFLISLTRAILLLGTSWNWIAMHLWK